MSITADKKINLRDKLSDDELEVLLHHAELIKLDEGDVFINEGEPCKDVYFIKTGEIEILKSYGDESREMQLAIIGDGELVGEMGLVDRSPRSATARALEPSTLLGIPIEELESNVQMGSIYTKFLRHLAESLATRLRYANDLSFQAHLKGNVDGLTKIANRRRFDDYLEQEWLHATTAKDTIGLLLMDVDHFKQYNDNYGHQAGDDVLVNVAHAIHVAFSEHTGLVARYGGEEFAVVMPHSNSESLQEVGQQLNQAVDKLNIKHEYSSATDHITISIGAAMMNPCDVNCEPNKLIELADKALYDAKEEGRNRVNFYKE